MSDERRKYNRVPLRNNQANLGKREHNLKGSDSYQTGEGLYQLQEVPLFPQMGLTFGFRIEPRRAN